MRQVTAALVFLWLAFVVRGIWYSALMPAWEGYDEPFHFAIRLALTPPAVVKVPAA